jgi:hypothetical protein
VFATPPVLSWGMVPVKIPAWKLAKVFNSLLMFLVNFIYPEEFFINLLLKGNG